MKFWMTNEHQWNSLWIGQFAQGSLLWFRGTGASLGCNKSLASASMPQWYVVMKHDEAKFCFGHELVSIGPCVGVPFVVGSLGVELSSPIFVVATATIGSISKEICFAWQGAAFRAFHVGPDLCFFAASAVNLSRFRPIDVMALHVAEPSFWGVAICAGVLQCALCREVLEKSIVEVMQDPTLPLTHNTLSDTSDVLLSAPTPSSKTSLQHS